MPTKRYLFALITGVIHAVLQELITGVSHAVLQELITGVSHAVLQVRMQRYAIINGVNLNTKLNIKYYIMFHITMNKIITVYV